MASVKNKVLSLIDEHEEEIISFLKSLIGIPSITEKEEEIQNFISQKLKRMNLKVDMWEPDWEKLKSHPGYVPVKIGYQRRPDVVGIYKGSGGGKSLLFNGHVDVIPASPANWDVDPWAGEVKEGKLYGRGASDMKGGLVAMTMAMDFILRAGIRLKGDVILEYVVDEEYSGHGTLSCILRGYGADAGICCEASDLEVQPASTGSMWFEVKIEGRTASMSRRWEAVSAVEKGYKVYQAIEELEKERIKRVTHPLYPDPKGSLACFVGQFLSGTFPSSLPAQCIIRGRMGALPGENPKKVQQELFDKIKDVAEKDSWLREHLPEAKFTGYYAEPAEILPEHPICKFVSKSFKEVTGKEALVKGHDGAADSRFLIEYGKTPTVIFGPGKISQMHADNEWVKVEDLIIATKVMAISILNWCGYEEV